MNRVKITTDANRLRAKSKEITAKAKDKKEEGAQTDVIHGERQDLDITEATRALYAGELDPVYEKQVRKELGIGPKDSFEGVDPQAVDLALGRVLGKRAQLDRRPKAREDAVAEALAPEKPKPKEKLLTRADDMDARNRVGEHLYTFKGPGEIEYSVYVKWNPGAREIWVEDIGTFGERPPGGDAGSLGPTIVRRIRDELFEHYPRAETLSGDRATGIRAKYLREKVTTIKKPSKVKPKPKPKPKPKEPERPTMAEAAADIARAKAKRLKDEEAAAKLEKKRQKDVEAGQPSLIDQEPAKRMAEAQKEAAQEAAFKAKQKSMFGEGYGKDNTLISPEGAAKLARDLKKKMHGPKAMPDITAAKEFIGLAVYHAEALARQAKTGMITYSAWAKRVRRAATDLYGKIHLTTKALKRLWVHHEVRRARLTVWQTKQPAPTPRGKLWEYMREAGEKHGQIGYDEWRLVQNRTNLAARMVSEQHLTMFKELSSQAETQLYLTARGVVGKNKDGSYQYGAIIRAGTRKLPKDAEARTLLTESEPPGTMLKDPKTGEDSGLVVGFDRADGRQQLYRVIWQDEAKRFHDNLKAKHPKAAEILDAMLEVEEPPVFTAYGDRLPAISRKALKERFGIDGLTAEEAGIASKLIKQAYGPLAEGRIVPNQFAWVPEYGLRSQRLIGRIRDAFTAERPSATRFKTGKAGEDMTALLKEYERRGLDPVDIDLHIDFGRANIRSRQELVRAKIHEEAIPNLLVTLAQPIKKGETIQSIKNDGWVIFSKQRMYEGNVRLAAFLQRNKKWLEERGIVLAKDAEAAINAAHSTKGKAWKIPSHLYEMMSPDYVKRTKSVDPQYREMMDRMNYVGANLVGMINVWRLTRVATANRNLIANQLIYTSKAVRDFYEGVLKRVWERDEVAPFSPFISDIKALGTTITPNVKRAAYRRSKGAGVVETFKALKPEPVNRIPPEMLGTTFLMEMEKTGWMTKQLGGRALRLTGFQFYDVYTKRLIYEAVIDANARQFWHSAVKKGETGGRTKKQYMAHFKKNVPRAVESLAYREMDTWGGYDYGNVPKALESWKRSAWGRATVPYPTYFYKLLGTYRELFGWHNVKAAMSPKSTRAQRIRGASNLMAGSTMMALAAWFIGDKGELPENVKETELPYDVQLHGRIKMRDLNDREGAWVRLYDMPFIGEVMAMRAIFQGDITVAHYVFDRLAMGPAFNTVAILSGLTTRFNKSHPMATRMGREISSWLPFHAETGTLRRWVDPWKRELGRKDKPHWFNLLSGVADNYPLLSTLLEKRVDVYRKALPKYHPMENFLSWAFLNVHFVNEDERDQAIALAELAILRDLDDLKDKDRLRKQLEPLVDEKGETVAGKIKLERKGTPIQLQIDKATIVYGREVIQTFDTQGGDAALKKGFELAQQIVEPQARRAVNTRMRNLVKKLRREKELGLAEMEIGKAPRYDQPRLRKRKEELERERR